MSLTQFEKYRNDYKIMEDGHKIIKGEAVHKINPLHKEAPSEKKHGVVINPAFYSSKHGINLSGNIINDGIHKKDVKHDKQIQRTTLQDAYPNDKQHNQHILLGGGLLVDKHKVK